MNQEHNIGGKHFICLLAELRLLRFHISGGVGEGTYCEFDSFLRSNTYKLRNQTCRTRLALICNNWQQMQRNQATQFKRTPASLLSTAYLCRIQRSPRSEAPSWHNQSCSYTSALQQRIRWTSDSAYGSSPDRWGTQLLLPWLRNHTHATWEVRQSHAENAVPSQDASPPAIEPRKNL